MTRKNKKQTRIGAVKKVWRFGKHLYERIMDADVFGLSAQLAYFFLLALFPFLLFLITLLGYLPIEETVFMDFIETYAPAEIMQMIQSNLTQIVQAQNGGLLSIGILGTLWSASNGVNAITKALNRAYEVEEDRVYIVSRLIAIGLTIAMVGVISIALILPIFGKMIGVYIFSLIDLSENFLELWNALRWIISSAAFFVVLLVLYKLAPNFKVPFKHAIWGAIFATIGWQLVSLAFSYYVNALGNFSATYGSLGTVIILMFWFYISGIIIITGGVINAVIQNKKEQD